MFLFLTIALSITAIGFVLAPLAISRLKPSDEIDDSDRNELNVRLYEERVAELGADSQLSAEERNQLEQDAKRDLLQDVNGETKSNPDVRPQGKGLIIAALIVPLMAAFLYADMGAGRGSITDVELSEALRQADPGNEAAYRDLVDRLAKRSARKPDNSDMRFLLARTYSNLGEYEKAAVQYEILINEFPDDANLAVFNAEALFIIDDRRMTDRVSKAVERALDLNPDSVSMLELKAVAAVVANDKAEAVRLFRQALATGVQGERAMLLRQALRQLGAEDSLVSGRVINVNLSLASGIELPDTAIIFVFARAIDGPPAPLAVKRLTPAQLPAEFRLDESMAMMPGMSLAEHSKVQVVARVSESGEVVARPGDLESKSAVLILDKEPVAVSLVLKDRVE